MNKYSQGICGDGAAILKGGVAMTVDEIVSELNQLSVNQKENICHYPDCNCPFDAPADPNWCARGYKQKHND